MIRRYHYHHGRKQRVRIISLTQSFHGRTLAPVQGEGGIRAVPVDYLPAIRQICDEHGILLMFDEVQSRVGRTGYLFAHQALGVEPDLLASAKGLDGGFPIGACLSKEHAAEVDEALELLAAPCTDLANL